MSGIVLSASVRQNLLSLQSTATLLAKTQNDLATGNKVNTALDNPTEFFTAQSLNNRASDISQPARRHRQRRAGAAGRQHRADLAAEPWSPARNRSPTRCCRARRVTTPNRRCDFGGHPRRDREQPARHRLHQQHGHRLADPQRQHHPPCAHQHHHPAGRHRRRCLQRPPDRHYPWLDADGRRQDHLVLARLRLPSAPTRSATSPSVSGPARR